MDETQFSFEVKVSTFMTYREDRIPLLPACDYKTPSETHVFDMLNPISVGPCGDVLLNRGAHSPVFFRNQKESVVLQDNTWVFGTPSSIVMNVKYEKIIFNAEMNFRDFPYDMQRLSMSVFRTTYIKTHIQSVFHYMYLLSDADT